MAHFKNKKCEVFIFDWTFFTVIHLFEQMKQIHRPVPDPENPLQAL